MSTAMQFCRKPLRATGNLPLVRVTAAHGEVARFDPKVAPLRPGRGS